MNNYNKNNCLIETFDEFLERKYNISQSYYYTKDDFNSLNEFLPAIPAAMVVAPAIGWGVHKGLNALSNKIKAAREKRKLRKTNQIK